MCVRVCVFDGGVCMCEGVYVRVCVRGWGRGGILRLNCLPPLSENTATYLCEQ